jgi:predicted transcriptional regulator
MKHEEVVAALKIIAEKGIPAGIKADDLKDLITYNLIDLDKADKNKYPTYLLTKKGRVMLKANSKPESDTQQ